MKEITRAELDRLIAEARAERKKPTEKYVTTKPDGTIVKTKINYRERSIETEIIRPVPKKPKKN